MSYVNFFFSKGYCFEIHRGYLQLLDGGDSWPWLKHISFHCQCKCVQLNIISAWERKNRNGQKKEKKSKASQVLRSQLSVSLKILHPLPLFYYLVISRHVKLSVHNGKNNRVCNLQRFLLVPLRAALPNKLLVLWLYLLFSQEEQG